MAGVTDAALNTEELLYLQTIALSEKIIKEGTVTKLDRIDSPLYNLIMSKSRKSAQPVLGDMSVYLSGNDNKKITWWDGRDILPFSSDESVMKATFRVGRGHMGIEFLLDLMARAGVQVDYGKGIRQGMGGAARAAAGRVAIKVIEEHFDQIRYNWVSEMRKTILGDNASEPKAFTGLAGLMPFTTTMTGTIGGLPRSNPLLQHNVVSGVTIDNFMLTFRQVHRRCTRFAKTPPTVFACGDNFYDMICDLFFGTSTRTGKLDFQRAQDKAAKQGESMSISLGENAFITPRGSLVINDPVFEEMQNEFGSSPSWSNIMLMLNLDHLYYVPVLEQTIPHDVPYNQKVSRTSYHGEGSMVLDHPRAQGVLIK